MHVSFHLKRKSCAGSFFVKEVSEHVRYSNCVQAGACIFERKDFQNYLTCLVEK